ncbi:MAG: hypothetical protein R2731_00110 [Nocardioides sp.]
MLHKHESLLIVHAEPPAKSTAAWTAARMRAAIPAVLGPTGKYLPPAQARAAEKAVAAKNPAPKSTGRLFFSYNGLDYSCSAATVFDKKLKKKKNNIATAGHCVHHGAGEGWHTNFAYVPKYRDGKAPLGIWTAAWSVAYKAWTNNSNVYRDQAMIRLAKLGGKTITDATEKNFAEYAAKKRQRKVKVVGWPAEAPYTGERVVFCKGPTKRRGTSSDAIIKCPMNGGASGGPWFKKMLSKNRGVIMAVTSRRTTTGTPKLMATPLPKTYRAMFKVKPT